MKNTMVKLEKLDKLTRYNNPQQWERVSNLIEAIKFLENDDIDEAAACVSFADFDGNRDIISADTLIDVVKNFDDIKEMIWMLDDIKGYSNYYRIDGYGWAQEITAEHLANEIEELTNELFEEIQ